MYLRFSTGLEFPELAKRLRPDLTGNRLGHVPVALATAGVAELNATGAGGYQVSLPSHSSACLADARSDATAKEPNDSQGTVAAALLADNPIIAEYWVIADDRNGYLVCFDPDANEFLLAQQFDNDRLATIGVRGDLVGVFMAR